MKTLSFVIPVYNEQERLKKAFKALKKGFSYGGIKLESVIFVNDGSTDQTLKVLKKAKPLLIKQLKAQVRIVSYAQNKGKGYAVKQGMLASDSDYTLMFDVDMSTPLSEFKKFAPYMKKNADVVIGTRKNGESTVVKHQPLVRELLGRGFTLISNLILNTWVTDFTCGFKLFSREARQAIWPKAVINGWSYDSEVIYLARKFGFFIQEKAVKWSNDERTKVNLLVDIPKTFLDLFYIRYIHFSLSNLFLFKTRATLAKS